MEGLTGHCWLSAPWTSSHSEGQRELGMVALRQMSVLGEGLMEMERRVPGQLVSTDSVYRSFYAPFGPSFLSPHSSDT